MSNEAILQELLKRWAEAEESGHPLSVDEVCAGHEQLREQFMRRIARWRAVNRRFGTRVSEHDDTLSDPSKPLAELDDVNCEIPFSNLQLHAAGGLGAVYRAEDVTLGRTVAVKFIHREQARRAENLDQFKLEAEVSGRLEHPGIVPVYGLGHAADGRMFYVMRFIEGHTLDEAIATFHREQHSHRDGHEHTLAYRDLLNCFVSVCKTIAYAHNRGIVHRDIKPQNIMLGRFGETLVVDWGLATPVSRTGQFKASGEKTLMPGSGSQDEASGGSAGTPVYMSPQQHSGFTPDPASDIYSLGMTLFKLLTGRTPFDGKSLSEIRLQSMQGAFPRPRELQPSISPAMEAICLKATALAPEDRYATALDLARDVESYLADETVTAFREPPTRRWARWARRNRTAAQSILLALVLVSLITVGSAIWLATLAGRERAARQDASQAEDEAVQTRIAAQRQSAYYAAKSVAYELEYLREVLLESTANDQLRQMLVRWNQTKDQAVQDELQRWIENRFAQKSAVAKAENWFIVDREGTQVARAPNGDSVGKNYRWRSYFHGGPRDLPPGSQAEPLQQKVYLGAVYRAIPYGQYKVPLSAPIRAPDSDEVVGVLGLAIDLGSYPVLQQASVVLLDLRTDYLENEAGKQGLILHHPDLARHLPAATSDVDERVELPRLRNAQTLRELERTEVGRGALLKDFVDPLDPNSAPQTVAFAPIQLSTAWPAELRRPGWVVVVLDGETSD